MTTTTETAAEQFERAAGQAQSTYRAAVRRAARCWQSALDAGADMTAATATYRRAVTDAMGARAAGQLAAWHVYEAATGRVVADLGGGVSVLERTAATRPGAMWGAPYAAHCADHGRLVCRRTVAEAEAAGRAHLAAEHAGWEAAGPDGTREAAGSIPELAAVTRERAGYWHVWETPNGADGPRIYRGMLTGGRAICERGCDHHTAQCLTRLAHV